MKLIDELKRRNVFRVGAAYVLLGWLVVQVTETVSPALNLPDWTLSLVIWLGVIGLPFALFFAWAYELTPEGVRRESDVERDSSATDSPGRRLDTVLVILLLVVVGFIAWSTVPGSQDADTTQRNAIADATSETAEHHEVDSIAVLPLYNMSAVSDNEYFSGGVHEELLTNLSRADGLRVVSRTTALRYINSGLSLSEIGEELRVRYIIEGSVRRINNHVRVTVQLIDASNDAHIWARNYDRELVDVFATQSEVAREIANSVLLEIRPDAVTAVEGLPTHSVRAYDLYTKASGLDRGKLPSEENYRQQRELLEAAVAEDPDFVEAWAALNGVLDEICRTIIQQDWFGDTEEQRRAALVEARQAALSAIDRAVALDADNVATLLARSTDFVAEQENPAYRLGRKQYIDRALELDPDNAEAWYTLGWWYDIAGKSDQATEPFQKSLQLDPLHAHRVAGALVHFRATGNEEMISMLAKRLVQIAPELGDEEDLARVPSRAKLRGLISLLAETADQSLIDTFAETLAAEKADFVGELDLDGTRPASAESLAAFEAQLLQLRNDLQGLVRYELPQLPDEPAFERLMDYMFVAHRVLAAQRITGRLDEARRTATLMLDARQHWEVKVNEGGSLFLPQVLAHLTLNDQEEMSRLRESVAMLLEKDAALYSGWVFVTIGYFERDRAVELLLAQKAQHPGWAATDYLAINHVVTRHMLTHPDMQAFYANEGKWLDYLAARVPEYGKLSEQTAR